MAHKKRLIRHLSVSPVPNLGKTPRLPQSDLTPWILTLGAGHMAIDMTHENSRDSNASFATFQSGGDLYKLSEYAKKHSIMMRVPEDTEGALTLVGALGAKYFFSSSCSLKRRGKYVSFAW